MIIPEQTNNLCGDAQERAAINTWTPSDHWELSKDADVGDPEQNAARRRIAEGDDTIGRQYVRGFVVVGMAPGENAYTAVIEQSFSMDLSKDRANIWLHRKKGDFGGTAENSAKHYADYFTKRDAPRVYKAYDIDDPECPVGLDWVDYERRVRRAAERGRWVDKYDGRNRIFYIRDTTVAYANAWYSAAQMEEIAAAAREQREHSSPLPTEEDGPGMPSNPNLKA